MADRIKLTITQVKDIVRVGEKQREKLAFIARGEDGKELSYSTMRTSLFDAIHNKPTPHDIEADVEETEREYQGNTFTNRNVSEVYVDGKAMGAVKGNFTAGRQWGGKPPEERAEIADQVTVKAVVDLFNAGNLDKDSVKVRGVMAWLEVRCAAMLENVHTLSKPSATEQLEEKPIDRTRQAPVEGESVRLELFKAQCKRKGWDVSTSKEGAAEVRAWLKKRPPHVPWSELTPEAQEEAISAMRKLADEKGGE